MTFLTAAEVRRVFIIGAGTMGTQIATLCAKAGFAVAVFDNDPRALKRLPAGLVQAPSLELAADADVVSESVIEDLTVKRRLWAEVSRIAPPRALLTTNTSTLLPSEIAEAVELPARFLAWHFHPPVEHNRLVDVMAHPGTAPEVVNAMTELTRRLGQEPLVLTKEHREYVFNSMLIALLSAAQELAIDGVTSIEEIDRAWKVGSGMRLGPFAIIDMIGLDTVLRILEVQLGANPNDKRLRRLHGLLKPKVALGELGVKSGRGFFRYG